MEYNFKEIEKKWQAKWKESNVYKVSNPSDSGQVPKPKCYVLDMFPYPSGAGLHVGHPLGYIASDIYARYKRLKGFNVLHPMGYDAFGLPAEQYAIDHGIHPAVSTENNINNFRRQLDNIGFSFDWDREIRTSDPKYYKWTQWIFLQLFKSFYNRNTNKAEPIDNLIAAFEKEGNASHPIPNSQFQIPLTTHYTPLTTFTADQWQSFDEKMQQNILMEYRLAYCGYGEVNWCEALGTVLANDEVINGVSERGGYPVVKKRLRQWYLRITEYADRLLDGLNKVDFSEAMKEMQTNWIGKSSGAEIDFRIRVGKPVETRKITYQDSSITIEDISITESENDEPLTVYTTRPDTIFGVDFMVIAPEHELVEQITTDEQKAAVDEYIAYVNSRSERERMAEKKITGVFTGAYAINPLSGKEIPIWISEYVLAGYGTGAIMGVPCGDERDHKFAKHFNIPITNIIGNYYDGEEANPTYEAKLENSDFLNGIEMRKAAEIVIAELELAGLGKRKVNYKMRDAAFSRQRYWGEPFPIVWKDGIAYPLDESELPLELPHVETYKPGPDGEGPLANIKEWALIPNPSPQVEKGAARVPRYEVHTPTQYELAKLMRKEHTEAEGKLWELLRGNKVGIKFRRQHPIDAYIVDFVSLQDRLIIEADGGYHDTEEQKKYDDERTKILKEIGFDVIRFTNEEIINDPYKVRDKIKSELSARIPSPLVERGQGVRETNTMPGYAGSSWYFFRYMDPHNDKEFCNRKISDYWGQVDLYIGGTEHAVGHLLYSRMWTKALYDLGYIGHDEPYKKLVNQGMIQGVSMLAKGIVKEEGENNYLRLMTPPEVKSKSAREVLKFYIPVEYVELINGQPAITRENFLKLKEHRPSLFGDWEFADLNNIQDSIEFETDINKESLIQNLNDNYVRLEPLVEKMSKSKYNVVNPDDIIFKYGADTFRMYEMFLGPVEMSKPWDTKGIEGVHRFLKKLWRLFFDEAKGTAYTFSPLGMEPKVVSKLVWNNEKPTNEELKVLHKTIKKIEEDTERFSFNTGVSSFMICVNELTDLKCHKKEVLEQLLILLAPYAPHISEELWSSLDNSSSILNADFPKYNPALLVESSKAYPVAINGKTRTELILALDITQQQVEEIVLKNEIVKKWLDGKPPKKIIYVKNKMINVVI
jgi:leucyl-tRNA synthetase